MAKNMRKDLEAKLAALDGAEWDSMSEDEDGAEDGLMDLTADESKREALEEPPVPLHTSGKKKSRPKAGGKHVVPIGPVGQPSGVIYIGHIPHGFYEDAMIGFFNQFGDVVRVRVARSKKSARSKGYAFVEFSSPEVAGIVAETMDGYYLFEKRLVCRVLMFDEVHPNLFDGAGTKFRKVNWHGLYREKYNVDRTPRQDHKKVRKLIAKDSSKRAKLAALGIEYDFSGYAAGARDRKLAEDSSQTEALRAAKSSRNVSKEGPQDDEERDLPTIKGKDLQAGEKMSAKSSQHENTCSDVRSPAGSDSKQSSKGRKKSASANVAIADVPTPTSDGKPPLHNGGGLAGAEGGRARAGDAAVTPGRKRRVETRTNENSQTLNSTNSAGLRGAKRKRSKATTSPVHFVRAPESAGMPSESSNTPQPRRKHGSNVTKGANPRSARRSKSSIQ